MEIKQLRIQKNLTQKQVAELTGISQQHISKIERGIIHPTLETFEKIVNAMGYVMTIEDESNYVLYEKSIIKS